MFCCFGAKKKPTKYDGKLLKRILTTDNLKEFKKSKYPRYFVRRTKDGTIERKSVLMLAAAHGAVWIVTYLALCGYINDSSMTIDNGMIIDEEYITKYIATYPALMPICDQYNIDYRDDLFCNNFIWAFKLPYERVKAITDAHISIQGIHRVMYYMSVFPQHTTSIFTKYILDRLSGKCPVSDINTLSRCILEFRDPYLFNLIRMRPNIYRFICNDLSIHNIDRLNEIQNKYTAGMKFSGFLDITITFNS